MIKIGILCKNFDELRNFEFRIIEYILNDPDLELSLLIFDGRKKDSKGSFLKKTLKILRQKKIVPRILLKAQELFEKKIFKLEEILDKKTLIEKLNSIDKIYLYPTRKGYLDVFSNEDSEKITKHKLDILLRHEFDIIRGNILNSTAHGIWSFHHGDNQVNRGGPSCFWEIVLDQKQVGVTLQKLTPELDGGYVIDRGFYNKHWSWIKTRNIVLESSVSLLTKNLNRLKNKKIQIEEPSLYYYKLYKQPGFRYILKYFYLFYTAIARIIIKKLNYSIFGIRDSCWSLVISKGNFSNSILFRLNPIIPPKNQFWADPFIMPYKKEKYVLFENYNYKTKKGKISCGKIENNNLIEIEDVLEKEYHLSYPFVINENKNLFLIPETSQNKRLEIYKCISFPNNWKLYSTAFEGELILDCTIYEDEIKQKWMFLNKKTTNSDGCSDLYIYLIDSLKLDKIIPHSNNPVITNSNIGRNAGSIFKENGKVYKPSQINHDGVYGKGLNLNEIIKLNLDEYEEINSKKCLPFFKENLSGIHHLDQKDDLFVTDICFIKK